MKIITIFRVLIVSLMVTFAQPVSCGSNMPMLPQAVVVDEDMSAEQKKELAEAALKSEVVVAEATKAMNAAQNALLGSQNEDTQNVAAIIAQNAIIVEANRAINKLRDQLVKKVEGAPEGYFSKFVTGAKNIAAKLLAPFRAGYGYSEDEKENAPGIIVGLNAQKAKVIEKYVALASAEQVQLKKRYDAIIAQFDDAIYQQQLITGEKRSTAFKVGVAVGAAAGAAMGKALVSKYLEAPAETTEPSTAGGPTLPITELTLPPVVGGPTGILPTVPMPKPVASQKGLTLQKNVELYHPNIEAGAKELIEAAGRSPEQEGYFEEAYGPGVTDVISPNIEVGAKELIEAAGRSPEQEGYFEEAYGPGVTGVVSPNIEVGAKELIEAAGRSPEQEGYFEETYGPGVTDVIAPKIEAGLQAISGATEAITPKIKAAVEQTPELVKSVKEKVTGKVRELLPESFTQRMQREARERWEKKALEAKDEAAAPVVAGTE